VPLYVFGVVFGFIAVASFFEQRQFERHGVRTMARVVAHETAHTHDKYHRPQERPVDVFEFTTSSGQLVRFADMQQTGDAHRSLGAHAEIFYPPAAPQKARLAGAMTLLWQVTLGFAVLSFVVASLLLRSWYRSRRSRNRELARTQRNAARRKRKELRRSPRR
jgi:hypothetical protein